MIDGAGSEVLWEAAEEVLARMFFVDLERDGGAQSDGPPPVFTEDEMVRVVFHGTPAGRLTLRLTPAAARSLAANFLGVEDAEVSDRALGEVACELANMVCGAALSRLAGAQCFQLEAPVSRQLEEEAPGAAGLLLSARLPHGRLTVTLEMDSPQCRFPAPSAC